MRGKGKNWVRKHERAMMQHWGNENSVNSRSEEGMRVNIILISNF